MTNRSLPHSVEAEEAVLGSLLINPDAFFDVRSFLKDNDFYLHKNRWIYTAIRELHEAGQPVDIITVSNALEQKSRLQEIGGAAYLTRLLNTVPTSLHAEAYGRLVQRESIRRQGIEAAAAIAKLAYAEDKDPNDLLSEIQKVTLALAERNAVGREARQAGEVAEEHYEYLTRLREDPDAFVGVPTHLIDLDRLLGGLKPETLITVAGRPGDGKTSLMLTIGLNAALHHNKRVVIYSLEMSNQQLNERLISMLTGIPVEVINRAALEGDEWLRFHEAAQKLKEIPLYLDDTPLLTPGSLRAKVARQQTATGLDLAIVDYLQLMAGDGKFDNRVVELSAISRGLKQISREFFIPVLAGSQMNRLIENRTDKEPQLSDLRESGSIEQDSDIVKFIRRTENLYLYDLWVKKNRQGPLGKINLHFKAQQTMFVNAAPQTMDLELV